MSGKDEFSGLLDQTISNIRSGHNAALKDLLKLVGKLRSAVLEKYGDRITVGLPRIGDSPEGQIFALKVGTKTASQHVVCFRLSPKGYPIEIGNFDMIFVGQESLPTSAALDAYFRKLISNPNSPFVVLLAYYLRKGS